MLEIDDLHFPRRLERLVSFVQIRGVHEASGSVLRCSSTPVNMTEQMNLGFFLQNRQEQFLAPEVRFSRRGLVEYSERWAVRDENVEVIWNLIPVPRG